MDTPPPAYDDIEYGRPIPTAPPAPEFSEGLNLPRNGTMAPNRINNSTVYTINGTQCRPQQLANNRRVCTVQGEPVYIISKAAVDNAIQRRQSRRNRILCILFTKIIVIIVVVVIILATNS